MTMFDFLAGLDRQRKALEQSLNRIDEVVPKADAPKKKTTADQLEDAGLLNYVEAAREQAQAMYDMAMASPLGAAWQQAVDQSPFVPAELKGRRMQLPEVQTWGEKMQRLLDERIRTLLNDEFLPAMREEFGQGEPKPKPLSSRPPRRRKRS